MYPIFVISISRTVIVHSLTCNDYQNFSLEVPTDHSIMEVTTITIITGILMLVWMDGYAETTETVPGSIQT